MSLASFFLAGIFGLGGPELLLILTVLLLLFGSTKLPALARGLGQSIREFKKAAIDAKEEEEEEEEDSTKKSPPPEHGKN